MGGNPFEKLTHVNLGTLIRLGGATREPPVGRWRTESIPSEMPKTTVYRVTDVENTHFPKIGLEEVYIGVDNKYPIIAIVAIWDKENAKSKHSQHGEIGFKAVGEHVQVEESNFGDTELHVYGLAPKRRARELAFQTGVNVNSYYAHYYGRSLTKGEQPYTLAIVPRPAAGSEYFLVFDKGAAELRGQDSPPSFLAVTFTFAPLSNAARNVARR